ARLGAEWVAKGFTEEVPKVLRRLQTIRLVNLSLKRQPLIGLFSQIPPELNALLQKLDLLSLFASPPKWAM
ncbi:hypothetical protein KZZ20_10970, partial [Methylacidiphilum fumariolicum]|nr:hypothetical protein [Candidatus Methylacidiphilum fumarolicum]